MAGIASSFTLDSIIFDVDPDNLSVQCDGLISVDKAISGQNYTTYILANSPAVMKRINISGVVLNEAGAAALLAKIGTKVVLTMASGGVVGTTGNFVLQSVSTSPTKPRLAIDGLLEGSYQYSYNISLIGVD